MKARWCCSFVLIFCAAPVCVALAQDISDRVRACAVEADDARRLACYDRAVERATSASSALLTPEPVSAPSTPTSSTAPSAPSSAEKFGYRGTIARDELDRKAAQGEAVGRIDATVVELAKQPRGELVLTLDNGQVWAQKAADALRIRVGDRVVIKNASFGSFLLVAPNNKTSRVVRQR